MAQFQTASPIGIEREDKPAEPYSYDPETDPLLKIPPEPQEQSETQPELVYYQLDHLGTPIAAHNAKGEAVWTAEYEAWGRIRQETVSDDPQSQRPVPLPRTVDILGLSKRKGAAVKDCSSECQLRDPCGSGSGQKPWSMRYEENSGKHKKMDIG